MTAKTLSEFCNPDATRDVLREPFRVESATGVACYTTDGKIAIRVREDVPGVWGDIPNAQHYAWKIDDFLAVGPSGCKKSAAEAYTLDGAAVARLASATAEALRRSHANALREDMGPWLRREVGCGVLSSFVERTAFVMFNGVPFAAHYVSLALRAFRASCRPPRAAVPALVVHVFRKKPCIWLSWPSTDVVLLGIRFPCPQHQSFYIERDGLTAVYFTAKPDREEPAK